MRFTAATALGATIVPRYRDFRVLDFDTECRPIAWYGGDWVTKQPTALAWKFTDSLGDPTVAVIGESFDSRNILEEEAAMLEAFVKAYDQADVVTGHYVIGFDLPLLNGALIRLGLPQLSDKLVQDTKIHLSRAQGWSKSQENIGAMLDLHHAKIGMNTAKWARANMLLPDGIQESIERVVGDVNQHIEMRAAMLEQRMLAPPTIWTAQASGKGSTYQQ